MITLQYLEPGPQISAVSPAQARDKLRAAFDIVPIDCLLLGWDLPVSLIDVCWEETGRYGVELYRWHPILSGDGIFIPHEAWQTRNLLGNPLPGFRGLSEFTFVCPNHPVARSAALAHLSEVVHSSQYAGIFLDRMRFPSPTEDPVYKLACFCGYCKRAAAQTGLDLDDVQQYLLKSEPIQVIRDLWDDSGVENSLLSFLKFRQQTITRFISEAIQVIRSADLTVGLDCYSPSLAHLVGQDLNALASLADWTKLMIYGHALGPATLPYEIGALLHCIVSSSDKSELEVLDFLAEKLGILIPATRAELMTSGFASAALAAEYARVQVDLENRTFISGIELVEIPNVSMLEEAQIRADLRAFQSVQSVGLALSWDLWHIPLERLEIVRDIWFRSTL